MTETRWWTYLQSLMGEQTQQEAAEKIGISKSNITRWKAGARADPDFVVKAARAYGANVLEALVEAEFITEQEANFADSATERELLRLLHDSALSVDAAAAQLISITGQLEGRFWDELEARRRSNTSAARVDPVGDDGVPGQAVAYSGPDEDALRQEDEDGD